MYDWNYQKKLLSQTIGVGVFLIIIPVDFSRIIFSSLDLQFPWINFILLLIWIIGIINSFNFIDGINTLAGVIAIIFLSSYGIILYSNSSIFPLEFIICIIFSIAGFLLFNRTPAKMFLGDSGSTYLGFIIATIPLVFLSNEGMGIDVTRPAIITSILLLETVYLIFSRIMKKQSPFTADRTHLHHQLLKLNIRNRHVVLIIAFFAVLLSIFAYFSNHLLFYQIVVIEFFLFIIMIVLPRLYKPTIQTQ